MTGTVHAGVKGNAGIVAKIALPPAAAVDYDGDIKEVKITSKDKDDGDVTFAEALNGGDQDYTVTITAIQSTETGSFWRLLWENPGAEFTLTYGPHGNAVIAADKPHFIMTIKSKGKPELGVGATREKARGEFSYEFEVTTPIVLDDVP